MARPARWIHRLETTDGGRILVTVGPNQYATSEVVTFDSLPRQDIRRVMGHLGYRAPLELSNESMIETITRHVADPSNIEHGTCRVLPRSNARSSRTGAASTSSGTVPTSTATTSTTDTEPTVPTSVATGGDESDPLRREVERIVDARLDVHGVNGTVSRDEVTAIVRDVVNATVTRPTTFVFRGVETATFTERTHFQFTELLQRVACRENMFLTGGPGVSKTWMARQVARALGIQCVVVNAKPLPQDAEVLGSHSPLDGRVIVGKAREVYEHGGTLVFDEIDTAHISFGPATNDLLSSTEFDFPAHGGGVERVARHPMCIFMATGNTHGRGGDMSFMGTVAMNGASLNRFTFMHIECDETLTLEVMRDSDATNGTSHAERVHEIWTTARRNIERYRLKVVMSPRDAFAIHAFLVGGFDEVAACRGRLFGRGDSTDIETKVMDGITLVGAK
jgi:MoxR-like ATPase